MLIVLDAHADGRYTQTKKASVESDQFLLDGRQIKKVTMSDFTQFRVRHASGLSIDYQDLFYIGMVQGLEQDTFPDHARCSGYDSFDFHDSTGTQALQSRDSIPAAAVVPRFLLRWK